jgi:hypothetical protein
MTRTPRNTLAAGAALLAALVAACAPALGPADDPVRAEPDGHAVAPAAAAVDPAPADPPAAPADPPPVAGACPAHPGRLWQELARLPLDRPDAPAPIRVELPDGASLPPRSEALEGDCQVVGGLGALAAPGRTLRRCCSRAARPDTASFPRGCMLPFSCRYELDGRTAETPAELAALVGPVDSPAQALGLVALHHVEILDPATIDLAGTSHYGFRGVAGAPTPFAVDLLASGRYRVRAAAYATCGCTHHVARLAFDVTRSGCVARVEAPPEPIAWSVGLCID